MEKIFDMRENTDCLDLPEMKRCNTLCLKINTCLPYTDEYHKLMKELFINNEYCYMIIAPLHVDLAKNVKIGKNVYINHDVDLMSRGEIEIGDDAMIGPNVSILTSNHDIKEHKILRCKKIIIKERAWIGAKSIILPGVTIGVNAVVGAGSVVTHDVDDYTLVAGNPAKFIKKIPYEK